MIFEMTPIAPVSSKRTAREYDHWGDIVATITLAPDIPDEALDGIEAFSHLEIIFCMHQVEPEKTNTYARHPRDNQSWPRVGIYAQRGSGRPNRIGVTIVTLLHRDVRALTVQGLDAIDGTPVLDIKPVFREFLPRDEVRQPAWVGEIMREYFR